MYNASMTSTTTKPPSDAKELMQSLLPLSAVDYHLLLVLAERDLYGYAILRSMAEESQGAVRLDIGSLYRALARLETTELVEPTSAPDDDEGVRAHPGRPRRYYRLTGLGRAVLTEEARRLQNAVRLARERALLSGSASR
jgi:DNA-binding PadR family transcriptional regulator